MTNLFDEKTVYNSDDELLERENVNTQPNPNSNVKTESQKHSKSCQLPKYNSEYMHELGLQWVILEIFLIRKL